MTQSEFFPGTPAHPCAHADVKVTLTPHMTHYAREDCNLCGKFVRWLPKPETLERAKFTAGVVERLKALRLTDWERNFVFSLEKQGFRLSPKQQEALDNITTKYLTT